MRTQYYAQFVPYGGSALSLDGGSLYAVSDVSFGATQTLNIGSQSSGAGAGKVSFDPLSFTLGSSNLTAQLDQMLASGTPFQQVNLFAVNGQGATVLTDTFKLAAAKSDAVDVLSGAHAITLQYGGLVESRTPQNADGSQGTASTAGWNTVRNVADNDPTTLIGAAGSTGTGIRPAFDPRAIAAGAASPDQSLHVYVQLRDYAGNLLGGSNGGWIAVDAANLESEQTLNIGSQSTGAGAGKVAFDPLQLTFKPGTLEPQLLQFEAGGNPLQIEIAAYGAAGQLVDDYRFGTAAIKTGERTVVDGTPSVSYTIEYGQEQVAHTSQDATGAASTTIQGWDRVKNVSLTSPTALPQIAPTTEAALQTTLATIGTGEGSKTHYYVQFVPYGGSALSLDGGSLYAVSDVSFGATQTLNIGSQSAGVGAGKVSFDPLSFTLGSSNLTARLDQMLASGTPFQQVNLFAVNGQGATIITDTFKLAAAKSDAVDVLSGAHAITLQYGGLVESRTPQNADGSQGTASTAGWNTVRNVADNDPTTLIGAAGSTGTGIRPAFDPRAIAAGAASPDQSLHVYVQFRDYAGNLLGGSNGGWIAVDAANLESEQTLNIGSQSTGAGAGKVAFDPLQLTFKPGTLEPQLLQFEAGGNPLQIEIAAYGAAGQLVDDYRFGTAAIKTGERTVVDGTPSVSYTIEYGQEQVAHTSQDATGAASTTIQGWDRVKNVSLTSPTALPQIAPTTEAALQTTLATIGTGEGSQTHYYVQFVPYGGSALSLDGGSLYAVSDVSFGATQTLNIGSQSSGAGAGKVSFDPLSFTLGSSNLTARLDQMLASGTPFQQVNLFAVNGQGATIITDTFKLAAAKSDAVDVLSGAHAITLQYGGLVESRTPQNADGSQGTASTAGWNTVRNVADNDPTTLVGAAAIPTTSALIASPMVRMTSAFDPRAIAAGAASPDQSLHVYVQLRDYAGNLLGGSNGGWIAVDAANLESEQTLNIGSQSTGAGAGKVAFDPLQLTFKPGTLEPQLLQFEAGGNPLQIEIAAYGAAGQLVDDYRFGTAAIKTGERTVVDGTPSVSYTIEYGQEQVAHTSQDATGAASTTIQGWDRVKNVSLTSPTALPQIAPTTEAALQTTLATIGTGETSSNPGLVTSGADDGSTSTLRFILADAPAGATILFAPAVSQVNLGTAPMLVADVAINGGTAGVTLSGASVATLSGTVGLAALTIGGGLILKNTGTVAQTDNVRLGDSAGGQGRIANGIGGNYDLTGDVGIAVGSSAGSFFNNNGGTLAKTAGSGTSVISASLQDGSATAAKILVQSGTLQFNGASNSFVAQAISGAGAFMIGGASTIGAGTTIATGGFGIARTGTTVTLAEGLTYAGSFTDTNATTINLGTNVFALGGAANFTAKTGGVPLVTGGSGSQLQLNGTTAVSGLTLGGAILVKNGGTLTQTGTVTLGDSTNQAAQINNKTGANWLLNGDVGIAAGSTAAVFNDNGGKLVKTAGGSTRSIVGVNITNLGTTQGTVRVGAGKLELAGTLTGNLALKADAGTTLILDKSASSGTAALYNGAGATLQLNDAQDFQGTIAGFAGGQTLDLRSLAFGSGTTAAPLYSSSPGGIGVLTVSDGTHTANLSMVGSYSAANFHTATDGHGGTAITFAALA